MSARSVFRGLAAALCAGALGAVLAVSASAQAIPLRVVQGSDGTLYLVQGENAWLLVPDQVSDEDLAVLSLGGEIDGTLPSELLTLPDPPPVAAGAAPPAPVAPAPAAPAPTASAAPAPTAPARAAAPVASPTLISRRGIATPPSAPTGPTPTGAAKGAATLAK